MAIGTEKMITYLLGLAGELVRLLKEKGKDNLETRRKIVRIKQALEVAKKTYNTSKIELMLADLGIKLQDGKVQYKNGMAPPGLQSKPQEEGVDTKPDEGRS